MAIYGNEAIIFTVGKTPFIDSVEGAYTLLKDKIGETPEISVCEKNYRIGISRKGIPHIDIPRHYAVIADGGKFEDFSRLSKDKNKSWLLLRFGRERVEREIIVTENQKLLMKGGGDIRAVAMMPGDEVFTARPPLFSANTAGDPERAWLYGFLFANSGSSAFGRPQILAQRRFALKETVKERAKKYGFKVSERFVKGMYKGDPKLDGIHDCFDQLALKDAKEELARYFRGRKPVEGHIPSDILELDTKSRLAFVSGALDGFWGRGLEVAQEESRVTARIRGEGVAKALSLLIESCDLPTALECLGDGVWGARKTTHFRSDWKLSFEMPFPGFFESRLLLKNVGCGSKAVFPETLPLLSVTEIVPENLDAYAFQAPGVDVSGLRLCF